MKVCRNCGEEFNDKFVFCPVDGTSLETPVAAESPSVVDEEATVIAPAARLAPSGANAFVAPPSNPAPNSARASSGNGKATLPMGAQTESEEYHLTMLQDEGLTRRLTKELREVAHEYELTWPEFKRDPGGFTKRMAAGYGEMTRRFFKQPYVAASILVGVFGMIFVLTALVFPYNDFYKWLASDGKLVADVGMSLQEVEANSTLKLSTPVPNPSSEEGEPTGLTISGDNLKFDFLHKGTNHLFEWSESYLITLDAEQKIKEIAVDLSLDPLSWRELAGTVRELDERLEDRGWRAFDREDEDKKIFQAAVFSDGGSASLPAPVEAQGEEIRWIAGDRDKVITLTVRPAEGSSPQSPRFLAHLKIAGFEPERLVAMLNELPEEVEKPDEGPAGTAKGAGGGAKPKYEKPGGGGGGGRNEPNPPSFGKLPPAEQLPQIVAPNPHPPTIKNPTLPVVPHIVGDKVLMPDDLRNIPYGDPKSTSTIPSSGPGEGEGIGTGRGTGVGSGDGRGYGPGRGENTGGGDTNYGGGGPGGGGGGTDYNKTFNARDVTRKAQITAKPEPGFTEEARKNNVQGTVVLRLVLGANGQVSNVSVLKGLPDGLTERALTAAKRIQFIPAQKDGRNVSQWVRIEYNFNIY